MRENRARYQRLEKSSCWAANNHEKRGQERRFSQKMNYYALVLLGHSIFLSIFWFY